MHGTECKKQCMEQKSTVKMSALINLKAQRGKEARDQDQPIKIEV